VGDAGEDRRLLVLDELVEDEEAFAGALGGAAGVERRGAGGGAVGFRAGDGRALGVA
jgi:hypothetical protein